MSGLIAPINYYPQQAMEVDTSTVPAVDNGSNMETKASLRSCTTCSKAKAKCVRRPGDSICERCARLKKECHLREPVTRRRKVVKTTRAAQLEKLESKIEHLVNALATTQSQRGFSVDLGQPSPPISHASEKSMVDNTVSHQRLLEHASSVRQQEVLESLCADIDEDASSSPSSAGIRDETPNEAANGPSTAPATPFSDYQNVGVSLPEAEILLDRYRRLMAPAMPFVVLPANATAQQLYAEKPTLLHAIVVTTSFHDLSAQQANVKRLLRNLSERIMINCEKSIDILQAITVFIGWYHPHVFWSHQGTNLMHLAMAMIIDLGFDRSPQQCGEFKKAATKAVHGASVERVPTAEEFRILAGIFYLTSTLSSSFKKIDAMPWTDYLANALVKLETAAEYESDLLLVQLVRLQHLIEQTTTTSSTHGATNIYTKAYVSDLCRLRSEDPFRETNIFLKLQYIITEVLIYELPLNDLQENKSTTLHSRLPDICHLIDAIKAYLDLFFSLPLASYYTCNFPVFGQFAHAFVILIKVASLEVEGWDIEVLKSRLDFLDTVEQAAVRFETAANSKPDGLDINNDHFSKWAIRIRWMKQVYEAKFVQSEGKGDEQQEAIKALLRPSRPTQESELACDTPFTATDPSAVCQQQQQQQPTPPDDVLSGDFFQYLDENFWQSFSGDFDLGWTEMSVT